MKIKRALVVYKKSALQVYVRERKDKRILSLIKKRHVATKRIRRSHAAHKDTLATVRRVLMSRGIRATYLYRAHRFRDTSYDLVISVGGDGTFLEASHCVQKRPMLGVNSNPGDSVGIFCGTTLDMFEEVLDRIESGRLKAVEMSRLRVMMGRKKFTTPVLNDVLITQECAADTSRYVLKVGSKSAEHKSSGIWIAPAAGSTAGIRGAGGKFLSISARKFQYRVRELYKDPRFRPQLVGGVLNSRQKISVISKMRSGRVYLDGSHLWYPFPIGEKVVVTMSAPRLKVYSFNEKRRKQSWR